MELNTILLTSLLGGAAADFIDVACAVSRAICHGLFHTNLCTFQQLSTKDENKWEVLKAALPMDRIKTLTSTCASSF